mmetsp:Transcript_2795/g.8373  ORF Transcript_2795/g.8373 Transcript_2795/m.8373 type:complete len:210 (+) Transcript_2795:722-1351(+)
MRLLVREIATLSIRSRNILGDSANSCFCFLIIYFVAHSMNLCLNVFELEGVIQFFSRKRNFYDRILCKGLFESLFEGKVLHASFCLKNFSLPGRRLERVNTKQKRPDSSPSVNVDATAKNGRLDHPLATNKAAITVKGGLPLSDAERFTPRRKGCSRFGDRRRSCVSCFNVCCCRSAVWCIEPGRRSLRIFRCFLRWRHHRVGYFIVRI